MGRVHQLAFKLYRFAVVLPPAVTWMRIRDKMLSPFTTARPAAEIAPLPHPIDRRYNIETSGLLGINELLTGREGDLHNTSYGGSQPSIIRRALRQIPDLDQATFLDLGCGKGRALAVATEFPFRAIVGVELVPNLAAIARGNAEQMRRQFPDRPPIEIIEGDASTTPLPKGPLVVFFYHPFFKALMKRVADHIETAMAIGRCPKVYVLYYNPVYHGLYDRIARFSRLYVEDMEFETEELGSGAAYGDRTDCVAIWQSRGPDMAPQQPNAEATINIIPPGWRATTRPVPSASARFINPWKRVKAGILGLSQ